MAKKAYYALMAGILIVRILGNVNAATFNAIGDYVQDEDAELIADFYHEGNGLYLDGLKTYERGDFTSYTWVNDTLTKTEAGILVDGTYTNIHSFIGLHPAGLISLKNPTHEMKEMISIDNDRIHYYESGIANDDSESLKMAINKGSLVYTVDTDFIPLRYIRQDGCEGGFDCYIDLEYRGKMILFGEEYYVKNIDGGSRIYLCKGKLLGNVTSEGYTTEYNGYKFKVDNLTYRDSCEGIIQGMSIDVSKPDSTVVTFRSFFNNNLFMGRVDDLEIIPISAEDNGTISYGVINITDTTSGNDTSLDINSAGFTSKWGYDFKIDHLISDCTLANETLLDVEKPDGTVVPVKTSRMAYGVVDDLVIAGLYAENASGIEIADIMVYDTTTQIILQDGGDLEIGGEVKKDWEVEFTVVNTCDDDVYCDISEYDEMDTGMENALLKKITITYDQDLDGDAALEEDESLLFPNDFRLTFKGYRKYDQYHQSILCSGAGEGNIVLDKGDNPYQLIVSLTGEDGNRYDEIRLDEGPFSKNDLFMANGVIYKYDKYEAEEGGTGAEDEITVILQPAITGSVKNITITLQRYCDPDDNGNIETTYTGQNCWDIGDIKMRTLALTNALDDDGGYYNDDEVEIDPYDLFILDGTSPDNYFGITMYFDDSGNTIFLTDDLYLTVEPDMVGTFDDFDTNGYDLSTYVIQECDLLNDPNSETYNTTCDVNEDGDDDDIIIAFVNEDGETVYVDMSDRDYNENVKYEYDTAVSLWNSTFPAGSNIIELDEDIDTLLITPEGGDKFIIDWGPDNRVDAVELCHPQDEVDVTYFIGTVEEQLVQLVGDLNGDGIVDLGEVINMINMWAQGQETLSDVIEAINNWVSGS